MISPEKALGRVVTMVLLMTPLGCRVEPIQASAPNTTPTATAEPTSSTSTSTPLPPTEIPTAIATATSSPIELPTATSTTTTIPSRPIPIQTPETAFEIPVYRANPEGKKISIVIAEPSPEELLVAYIRLENCGGRETASPWVFKAKELRKQGNGFTGGNQERTFSAVKVRDTWRGAITDKLCSKDRTEFTATSQGAGPEVLGSEWIRAHRDIYGAPVYGSPSSALADLEKWCLCAIPRLPGAK